MNVVKGMSIFWILYGIAGLFGFRNIPDKFRGYAWTKDYMHRQAFSWILLGVPYFLLSFVVPVYFPGLTGRMTSLLIVALGMPAFFYSVWVDRKYKALLKKEQTETQNKP